MIPGRRVTLSGGAGLLPAGRDDRRGPGEARRRRALLGEAQRQEHLRGGQRGDGRSRAATRWRRASRTSTRWSRRSTPSRCTRATTRRTWPPTRWRSARSSGWARSRIVKLRRAAFFHDIGKIAVPRSTLAKPGALDDDEWAEIRIHPARGRHDARARGPVGGGPVGRPAPRARGRSRLPARHHRRGDRPRGAHHLRGRRVRGDDLGPALPPGHGGRRRRSPSCASAPGRSSTPTWWRRWSRCWSATRSPCSLRACAGAAHDVAQRPLIRRPTARRSPRAARRAGRAPAPRISAPSSVRAISFTRRSRGESRRSISPRASIRSTMPGDVRGVAAALLGDARSSAISAPGSSR